MAAWESAFATSAENPSLLLRDVSVQGAPETAANDETDKCGAHAKCRDGEGDAAESDLQDWLAADPVAQSTPAEDRREGAEGEEGLDEASVVSQLLLLVRDSHVPQLLSDEGEDLWNRSQRPAARQRRRGAHSPS